MTTHPSFQPSLRRSEVKLLLSRLHDMQPAEYMPAEYMDGFNAAKAESAELLTMMWQAAIIANYAARQDMTDHLAALEENGPTAEGRHHAH